MKNMLAKTLKSLAQFLFRYGLAVVLIWLGLLKFKNSEAEYVQQVIASSPLISWMLKYVTAYTIAMILAYLQIITGLLLALKPVSKRLAFWGGLLAVLFLLMSVSILFTSGNVWQSGYGFPELSKLGQSILKDVILLAAAAWCVGDSL